MNNTYNDESEKSKQFKLWEKWLNHRDEAALAQLVSEINPKLILFLMSFKCTREDAEDIAQEALIKVIFHPRGIEIRDNIRGYIFATAIRMLFYYRKKKRLTTDLDQILTHTITTSNPDENLEDELLIAMKRVLDDRQYKCVLLHYWQGFSYREIAQKCGFTEPQVRTFLFHARQQLRLLLTGLAPGNSP